MNKQGNQMGTMTNTDWPDKEGGGSHMHPHFKHLITVSKWCQVHAVLQCWHNGNTLLILAHTYTWSQCVSAVIMTVTILNVSHHINNTEETLMKNHPVERLSLFLKPLLLEPVCSYFHLMNLRQRPLLRPLSVDLSDGLQPLYNK